MSAVTVFVPKDAAAVSVGADDVAIALSQEAQSRGIEINLIRNGSRGLLWLEPLVEVETSSGRFAFGPVSVSDISGLFDAGFLSGGDHDLGHGLTEEIPYLANQERLTFARCGVIDPLDLTAYESHGGLVGLKKALERESSAIVEDVTVSGLRGRGGAGFPAGIKWETVRKESADQKYICCNADEGDSGTFADRMLMEGDPFTLLEGMVIAGRAVGADTGYIYIRSEYPHAIRALNEAISIFEQANLLGQNILGSGLAFTIHIRIGGGAYICGEESSMLESLEGKRGQVRAKPPIPAISGLFGKPTVVNNVLTLATVPYVLASGGKTYSEYGQGKSRGTQPFQLAGDIARGGLVEKAFGVTLRELVEGFGGGTRSGRPVRTAQVGGPLGAYIPETAFNVDMDYESLAESGAMLGHGGVVVFNESVDMARQARFAMEFCEIESCGKCTPCRIGSVRGKETLDKIIVGEDLEKNLAVLDDLCVLMTDGSLCAMGGLTPMPVTSALKHFPEDFGLARQAAE
ncbi:MAG: formate dehydrogenase [Alphaproteobacteria bacterium]|nr:formate dehydrogenase [Alphaproteobacteria bacterium]